MNIWATSNIVKTLAASLALTLLFTAAATAGMSMHPRGMLFKSIMSAEPDEVATLLTDHSMDSDSLGKALLRCITRISDKNRDASIRIAHLLLDKGANFDYLDSAGRSPLTIAEKRGEAGLVALMDEHRNAKPAPEVVNLKTSIEGRQVRIDYDLISDKPACILVRGSTDGGRSYDMKIKHLKGDHGKKVAPGASKKVYWAALSDYPKGFGDADVIIDVIAQINCM